MIRLQAKQEQRTALLSVEKADTQVACVAQALTQTIRYNDKEIICETERAAGNFTSSGSVHS